MQNYILGWKSTREIHDKGITDSKTKWNITAMLISSHRAAWKENPFNSTLLHSAWALEHSEVYLLKKIINRGRILSICTCTCTGFHTGFWDWGEGGGGGRGNIPGLPPLLNETVTYVTLLLLSFFHTFSPECYNPRSYMHMVSPSSCVSSCALLHIATTSCVL